MSEFQLDHLQEIFSSKEIDLSKNTALKLTPIDNTNDVFVFNQHLQFYPASLIKLFAAYQATALLKKDPRYKDDLKEAIELALKESDNDALSILYDFISGTQSGLPLEQREYEEFKAKRKTISNSFSKDINLHAKCFSHAPYGRDLQLYKDLGSNSLVIDDVDSIMQKIIQGQPELLCHMSRTGSDYQSEFIFKGLEQFELDFFYSKAAWTSTVRHDTAYFSIEGKKYILTILTKGLSNKRS